MLNVLLEDVEFHKGETTLLHSNAIFLSFYIVYPLVLVHYQSLHFSFQ